MAYNFEICQREYGFNCDCLTCNYCLSLRYILHLSCRQSITSLGPTYPSNTPTVDQSSNTNMPKAKAVRSKKARSEPYSKSHKTTSSSILKTKPNGQKAFPFLDLPFELRMSIYAYFLQMTPYYLVCLRLPLRSLPTSAQTPDDLATLRDSERDYAVISRTRKALNRVCRQITAEWSPLFWETTSSIVHASKGNLGYFQPRHMILDPFCNPWNFANDFLRVLQPSKLAMIKRIAYDIRPGDFDSFADFPKLLMKHIDRLPALEQLTLNSNAHGLGDHGFVRLGSYPMEVWRLSNWHHRWEQIEQRFLGIGRKNQTIRAKRNGAGVLQGWNATRKLRVHRAYPRDGHLTIRGVAVIFKKAGSATTGTEPPSIKLLFEG